MLIHSVQIFLYVLRIWTLFSDYYCRKATIKMCDFSVKYTSIILITCMWFICHCYVIRIKAGKSYRKFHSKNMILSNIITNVSKHWYNLFFHQTACDEPIIPANGSLHSTSKSSIPNGKYPKLTEVIFQYQTGNGTALRHSFCKDGNWTRLTPLNGINNRLFNNQSIQAKICEVSSNDIKFFAQDTQCWTIKNINGILCKLAIYFFVDNDDDDEANLSLQNYLFHSRPTVKLLKYQYVFLLARCDDPTDSTNQTARYINEEKRPRVNGKYREGTEAYFFECELEPGSQILHRPSVCQANGEWTQTSGCEGIRSTGSSW